MEKERGQKVDHIKFKRFKPTTDEDQQGPGASAAVAAADVASGSGARSLTPDASMENNDDSGIYIYFIYLQIHRVHL